MAAWSRVILAILRLAIPLLAVLGGGHRGAAGKPAIRHDLLLKALKARRKARLAVLVRRHGKEKASDAAPPDHADDIAAS